MPPRFNRQLLFFALLAGATTQAGFTCGPGIDPPGITCDSGAPPSGRTIEVGRIDADGAFQPLSLDQVYAPEFGNQGGQHIFVAARFYAPDGEEEWGHNFRLIDDAGNEFGSRYIIERTCAPGWTVIDNLQVFVYAPDVPEATIEVTSGPIDLNGEQTETASTSGRIRLQ